MNLAARVRPRRLLDDLEALARISEPGAGVTRLGYSAQEREAHAWLAARMREAGLVPESDPAGNLFGWLTPPDGRPVLLAGSHLDSVPQGGRFDGALGVLAALEVLRAWKETGPVSGGPVGMVAFACEESSRFGVGCLGSRWLVGTLTPARAQCIRDRTGCTLWEGMAAAGCNVGRVTEAGRSLGWLRGFLEVHIDQGRDLVEAGAPLGVVTDIADPTKLGAEFEGEAGHAGTLPASRRRDAAVAAAHLVLSLAAMGRQHEAGGVFVTAGTLEVWPGSVNTVPGRSRVGIDLRCPQAELQEALLADIDGAVRAAAERARVKGRLEVLERGTPVQTDSWLVRAIELAAARQGVACPRVVSRAGHDARHLARLGPVGMLFVRNPAGVSHQPAEAASADDLAVALAVLAGALEILAGPA